MSNAEPDAILFQTSPYGNVDAIVQHDQRVVYFLFNGHAVDGKQPFGTRACWVRNLIEAPYVLNEDEAKAGVAPLLPRTHCHHPRPQALPNADDLKIIWFEEGNGAALVETESDENSPTFGQTKTLAVIPPWSGLEGFHGYAAGAAAESPLCWPMPDNPKLDQRITAAAEFWDSFEPGAQHPFAELQTNTLSDYRAAFAPDEDYHSIDGGRFPPRGLATFQTTPDAPMTLATVGLAMCPQPAVELFVDSPSQNRRIELAVQLSPQQASTQETVDSIRQQLSGLAAYPWRNFTWLGPGHTVGLRGLLPDSQLALLVRDDQFSKAKQQSPVSLKPFRGDPVNLLWLVPATSSQQQQLESGELKVEDLL